MGEDEVKANPSSLELFEFNYCVNMVVPFSFRHSTL